ncbi:MAG: guanosine monophosphate reductase [Candidatus Buchananbacteria bacterium CG10_big_fil_rev_8_21_14_0_10_42_9]|uniref:Guanosine monophosphate reductase n=1 Tax=Candidatus Buchananbacteria bacterium CG10_big_fil_rev_8_21_14_0_10_42_9 TaxID=1974526 RepID=A0A2H0W224_9BACT|nr:MAG: guanosine monophosphate reductase [Candidatus Buchananbacteria bacterium CG10_big_fil_rev_8_21_14_0_10_42_9]
MPIKPAYTFDDILLVPQKAVRSPRYVSTRTKLTKKITLDTPLISSPMDTVTESKMAIALAAAGGLGVIHKNLTPQKQAAEVSKVKNKNLLVGAAIGVSETELDRAARLAKANVDIITVDAAHGHYVGVLKMVKKLKQDKRFKKVEVIGGNVATGQGGKDLVKAGADAVKVGVGPGSICTTRVIAGIGVPQFSAIMNVAKTIAKTKVPVIGDGGIKFSGDVVKALAAGANTVMIGGLFGGTAETPGKIISKKGKRFKEYRGMGSLQAMKKGSKDRYLQKNLRHIELIAEGVSATVPFKGPVQNVIYQLIGGLKQGMGYCGAKTIPELQRKAQFVFITKAGYYESHPHSLASFEDNPNYSVPKEDKFL